MEITFKTNKLQKCCNNESEGTKVWGERIARKVFRRLMELRAAQNLAQISHLPPPKLHSINGIRKGCFAVYTEHPHRLIFKPNHEPVPHLPDGGVDKANVTRILILEVEDYHGKRK